MFIGHFGVGFAAKKAADRVSLGTLFIAAQFIDLIWPVLLLLGIERVEIDPGNTAFTPLNFVYYPFTHSFIGVLIWGLLLGLGYYLFKKQLKTALLLGSLVVSHWLLDLIVHRPDLPLLPWSDMKVGMGLWNSILFSVIVEGLIFLGGIFLYTRTTRAMNKKGSIGMYGLLLFLVIIYVMNIFSPPPESAQAIGVVGLFQWLLVAWAYWIDRNRTIIQQPVSTTSIISEPNSANI